MYENTIFALLLKSFHFPGTPQISIEMECAKQQTKEGER